MPIPDGLSRIRRAIPDKTITTGAISKQPTIPSLDRAVYNKRNYENKIITIRYSKNVYQDDCFSFKCYMEFIFICYIGNNRQHTESFLINNVEISL